MYLLNSFRVVYYKLLGVKIPFNAVIRSGSDISGKVTIGPKVHINKDVRIKGTVNIGSGSYIDRGVAIIGNVDIGRNTVVGSCTILSTMPKGYLKIGNDVLVNAFSVLGSSERVEIKDHCVFAAYVQITDAEHGFEDPAVLIKHAPFTTAPVVVEENVWFGSGVVVLKGVTVGSGAVIGAKSLVTKDIPALGIAYGTPAKVVKTRGQLGS
jgi:acetyltransferase-like isoleucine patch superfamily enzyme